MAAKHRVDVGGHVYHAYNRGNAGGQLFVTDKDYLAFEHIVVEAKMLTKMNILAYCVMPNHWHFVLQPANDGDMGAFFHRLTITHTKRWHMAHGSSGSGHIYQGTYKSNLVQEDNHFLRLARYVERNALRAKLVDAAEKWPWSSGWRRQFGTEQQKTLLAEWPVPMPSDYDSTLNEMEDEEELATVRTASKRGRPYGAGMWMDEMITRYGLEHTIRPQGRPRKKEI